MSPLRTAHATVSTSAISDFVSDRFPVGQVEHCRLINRGFNDCYLVETSAGRFVLRLSRTGRRRVVELAEEASYIDHLKRHGVPVAETVCGHDGRFEQIAEASDGERGALLFTFLEGRVYRENPSDAAANGETLARVHMISETFTGKGSRPELDIDRLLDQPIRALLSVISGRQDAHDIIVRVADRLRACVADVAPHLTRGYCHGDCHGYNALFDADGSATFFDFDDGGPGWLAYDLSVFLWSAYISGSSERRALWQHFLRGYERHQRVALADLDAVPIFIAIRHLWLLGEYATGVGSWGTIWLGQWFDRQLDFLKRWHDEQLSDPLGLVDIPRQR